MILIGQYDSPFVRRVAVALLIYGFDYEHRPWSTFGDAAKIAAFNPLSRVPTLVLDDGEVLIESAAILDHLDDIVGWPRALIEEHGPGRRAALKICALAAGLNDKMVSLIYERALHRQTSPVWLERCEAQVRSVLDALETDRAGRATRYWLGDRIGHPDIAVACAMRFLGEAHPAIFGLGRWPRLVSHGQHCETLQPFKAVTQIFTPPSG